MPWWLWLIFWIAFTLCSVAYLAWRCWKLVPPARRFGQGVSQAVSKVSEARQDASAAASSRELTIAGQQSDLAWDRPAKHWREERKAQKQQQADERRDGYAAVWSTWRDHVD